jgi:hypothetical protein
MDLTCWYDKIILGNASPLSSGTNRNIYGAMRNVSGSMRSRCGSIRHTSVNIRPAVPHILGYPASGQAQNPCNYVLYAVPDPSKTVGEESSPWAESQ